MFECFFRKSIEKIQNLLKSDRNNGCSTCKPKYVFNNFALISTQNEKYFDKSCRDDDNDDDNDNNNLHPCRTFLVVHLQVFQVVFVHFVHNSALYLASCCSFLLHAVANLFCVFLDSRQLILLSTPPKVLNSFVNVKKLHPSILLKIFISNAVSSFHPFV